MMVGDHGMAVGDVVMSRAQLVVGAPLALAVGPVAVRQASPRGDLSVRAHGGTAEDLVAGRLEQGGTYRRGAGVWVSACGVQAATEVETCFAGSSSAAPSLEVAIARAEHRDGDAGGPFDDDAPAVVPASGHRRDQRMVSVDGAERPVVVSRGDYATLRFRDGAVVVTAVARLGFPGQLTFAVIDDLESYFAGYRRLMRSFLVPWSK